MAIRCRGGVAAVCVYRFVPVRSEHPADRSRPNGKAGRKQRRGSDGNAISGRVAAVTPRRAADYIAWLLIANGRIKGLLVEGPLPAAVVALDDRPLAHGFRIDACRHRRPQIHATQTPVEFRQLDIRRVRTHETGGHGEHFVVALRRAGRFSAIAIAKFVQRPFVECLAGAVGEDRAIEFGRLDMELGRCGDIPVRFGKEFPVRRENG